MRTVDLRRELEATNDLDDRQTWEAAINYLFWAMHERGIGGDNAFLSETKKELSAATRSRAEGWDAQN